LSTGRSEPLSLPGLPWPIELRSHPRARAVRLRVDERRQLLTLTVPVRMSRRAALDWARRQADWVETQLFGIGPAEPFLPGACIPFEGRELSLHWSMGLPRTAQIVGEQLQAGGPEASFAARIERFLRKRALERLSLETADAAHRAGVKINSVSVGDPRSRWGSCSSTGAIRYSWRLVMAPPHLLRWLVAHEVAHRRHMNHGPQFHALEAVLYGGDVRAARAELRALGPRLKRIGRTL
jgi:predicted metal-dependent hydrolase